MAGMETRGGVRIKLDSSATLKANGPLKEQIRPLHEKQKAIVADVSVLGLGVISPVFFPKGAILKIQMDGAAFNIGKPINIRGEVRYCKPERGKKYKLGIKFVEIEDKVLEKIKEYVIKNERREVPRVEFK